MHHAEWIEPLVTTYRGVDVYAMGGQYARASQRCRCSTFSRISICARWAFNPPTRSTRKPRPSAWPMRIVPAIMRIRISRTFRSSWLNSKAYAAERAKLIRPDRIRAPDCPAGPDHGDTTYFTVADHDGMMVSMIQSNFRGMGSGLVADGLGFMFQSRGQLFSLVDGHPNVVSAGQTSVSDHHSRVCRARAGAPGCRSASWEADMQPQGQTQILVNRVDYGLDIQAAGDSPRWHHQGSPQSMGEDEPGLGPRASSSWSPACRRRRGAGCCREVGRSARRMADSADTNASSFAAPGRRGFTRPRARCGRTESRLPTDVAKLGRCRREDGTGIDVASGYGSMDS